MERELAQGMILTAGYFGTRGNHLTRQAEENPFEPALGTRFNPNLASPLLTDLTDGQSFYNSFQVSVSKRYAHNLFWQASYTLAHSVDDSSVDFNVESVNDPPISQNIFDRKGSRGPSDFDVRHNFTANVVYDLPGHGRVLSGWQVSGVASVHSGLPFTPVLAFDNADIQSLVVPERPNLIGNPYTGACPNGARVGTPSCWFNPSAFAVPPAGQFGNAGRNILRGPAFAQIDASLHKDFAIGERRKITLGVEAYNLFNHPNFGVPINTQSPFELGGTGDAIFKRCGRSFRRQRRPNPDHRRHRAPDSTGWPVYVLRGSAMAAASEYLLEPIRDGAEFTLYRARQRGNPCRFWSSLRRRNNRCPRVCDAWSTNTRSQPNLSLRGRPGLWRSRVRRDGQSSFSPILAVSLSTAFLSGIKEHRSIWRVFWALPLTWQRRSAMSTSVV